MTYFVHQGDALTAWQAGAHLVHDRTDIFNLITTIADPLRREDSWYERYSPRAINANYRSLGEVEHTVFPRRMYERVGSRGELYERYWLVHTRGRQIHRKRKGWGTYFERMIGFGEKRTNQLEEVVTALTTWRTNWKAALAMHMSSATLDGVRQTRGNPCMQYVEFTCPDKDSVDLLAVYRNHDFFERALGNFIGLGQLLRFVASESGRYPGEVVCHSAHAYSACGKRPLREFAS